MGRKPRHVPLNLGALKRFFHMNTETRGNRNQAVSVAFLSAAVLYEIIPPRFAALAWFSNLRENMKAGRFDLARYNADELASRDDAVVVPRWIFDCIADGFDEFVQRDADSLDAAFESKGENRSARQKFEDAKWWLILAILVYEEKVLAQSSGKPVSDEAAFQLVVERFEGATNEAGKSIQPSFETVKAAWRQWRDMLKGIQLGIFPFADPDE